MGGSSNSLRVVQYYTRQFRLRASFRKTETGRTQGHSILVKNSTASMIVLEISRLPYSTTWLQYVVLVLHEAPREGYESTLHRIVTSAPLYSVRVTRSSGADLAGGCA